MMQGFSNDAKVRNFHCRLSLCDFVTVSIRNSCLVHVVSYVVQPYSYDVLRWLVALQANCVVFLLWKKVVNLYNEKCQKTLMRGVRQGYISGTGLAFSDFVLFTCSALAFWYGSKSVQQGKTVKLALAIRASHRLLAGSVTTETYVTSGLWRICELSWWTS
jgi:hypothetical protein